VSVGISWVEYHPTVLGRAEANWLVNHIGASDETPNMVFIDEERAKEALESAAECDGCEYFDETNKGMELHAEVTEQMRSWLPVILAEAKAKCGANCVDLAISW